MKVNFLKLKNWLLVSLMSAMGLSSCHCHKQLAEPEPEPEPKVNPREEIRLMYGVPTMDFSIRGQVRDAEGKPVSNIHVNMLERNMEVADDQLQGDPKRVERWLESTAVVTDRQGRFEIRNNGTSPQEQVRLLVRDVDGDKNGEYKDQFFEVEINGADIDRSNASGWQQGTVKKSVDITLEKK